LNVPSLGALDAAESALGLSAAIVGTFADWAGTPDFPCGLAEAVDARGAITLVSWEPWDAVSGTAAQPAYRLARIAAGEHDDLVDRWAAGVARYGRPVMLRFGAEMNGDWLPWSTGVNGNRTGDYVAAWRHVRDRFRRAGAERAVWVWNPIAPYAGSTPLPELFPGGEHVDWLALDGYNWGALRGWGWQGYGDVFAPAVQSVRRLAPRHPLMIAETGCAPDRRKPAWVTETLRSARAGGLGAVVWFEFVKETDWRLTGSAAAAAAARAEVAGAGWRQGGERTAVIAGERSREA
jgi:beta-mannanase